MALTVDMETVFGISRRLIRNLSRPYRRPLGGRISGRRDLLTGSRGIGKSTWMAQEILRQYSDYEQSTRCLYLPADHMSVSRHSLYEVVEAFAEQGGQLICIDEVHRCEGWSRDLKSIADTYPELQIIATGSSLLHLQKGTHDLSRRFVLHRMDGLSFREFLQLHHQLAFDALPLDTLIAGHETLASEIDAQIAATGENVLRLFQDYLQFGYYPYSLDIRDGDSYMRTLQQSAMTSLESDLPAVYPSLTGATVKRIRRLLAAVSETVPFSPDLAKLRRLLNIADDRTLKDYLSYLEDGHLIYNLPREGSPIAAMGKPDRIYVGDPNLAYALSYPQKPDTGALREIFFLRAFPRDTQITAAKHADFLVNGEHTFEVGGRNKTTKQLKGRTQSFIVFDGARVGTGKRIPLWLFGFLK